VRKADNLPPSCAVVTKSGNLNFLEPSGPVTGLLYLYRLLGNLANPLTQYFACVQQFIVVSALTLLPPLRRPFPIRLHAPLVGLFQSSFRLQEDLHFACRRTCQLRLLMGCSQRVIFHLLSGHTPLHCPNYIP